MAAPTRPGDRYPVRKLRKYGKLAVDRFDMLPEGRTAVIGLSGGTDSLCAADLLAWYNRHRNKGWRLVAVHVHPGFPGWDSGAVARACAEIGIEYLEKRVDVPAKLKATQDDSCFFCARERRKTLFRTAAELGTERVVLAHNLDDVNETFFINLLFTSSGTTFVPRQELFDGRIIVVRPLYYVDKPLVERYCRARGLTPVKNRCPFEHTSSRTRLRTFLNDLYRAERHIRTNIFWGLHNLKPPYLPPRAGPGVPGDRSGSCRRRR